jgi:hypothetical protein
MGIDRRTPPLAAGSLTGPLCLALLGLLTAPAGHTAPIIGCGPLCGAWKLDPGASDDPKARIETAVAGFKEPKQPRRPRASMRDLDDSYIPPAEPLHPGWTMRDELRSELQTEVAIPEQLAFAAEGKDIVLTEGTRRPRRVQPDEPYSRVDTHGIATIRTRWSSAELSISESYQHGEGRSEAYVIERVTGRLIVTRTLKRERMPKLIIKSVYVRG